MIRSKSFLLSNNKLSIYSYSLRNINYFQRMRNSARGKNWDRWYNNFKTKDPYFIDDPTHIKWFPKELRENKNLLQTKLYQRLFCSTNEEINFKRACISVDTIRLDHGIPPKSWMYAGVLYHIGSTKDTYYMNYFWKQLKQNKSIKLEANAYNAIIHSLASCYDIEGAQYIIEEMKEEGIPINANTYNSLCTFDRPNLYFMEAIIETLNNKKIKLNTDTYTLMINTYTREVDFEKANKMFTEIQQNDCKPHIYAFNALMNSRCKAEYPNEARDVLEHLHSDKPFNVEPETSTYNVLLNYYDTHGKDKEALDLFNLMRDRKVYIDVDTYNCVLRSLYNAGKPTEAIKFFETFHFRRNEATYAAAIDACVQGGEYDKAVSLHNTAKNHGFSYNEHTAKPTYNDLLTILYPRRCDYWEPCGEYHMTWDRAISFDKV